MPMMTYGCDGERKAQASGNRDESLDEGSRLEIRHRLQHKMIVKH